MKKLLIPFALFIMTAVSNAQTPFTEENLWDLKYLSGLQVSPDQQYALVMQRSYSLDANKGSNDILLLRTANPEKGPVNLTQSSGVSESNACFYNNGIAFLSDEGGSSQIWFMQTDGSGKTKISDIEGGVSEFRFSPDGRYLAYTADVKLENIHSTKFRDLPKATGRIYDGLMMRHWNVWDEGTYSHLFVSEVKDGLIAKGKDLLYGEPYDFPVKPMDGIDQLDWHPSGNYLAYACKKKAGTEYAVSTNSDIYVYEIASGRTLNISEENKGYDKEPRFSPDGNRIVWLSMERDGYEADRNRILKKEISILPQGFSYEMYATELTKGFDYNAHNPVWSADASILYFTVEINGTIQAYRYLMVAGSNAERLKAVTSGIHNINSIAVLNRTVKVSKKKTKNVTTLLGLKSTMMQPNELFAWNVSESPAPGKGIPAAPEAWTHVNDDYLKNKSLPTVEQRWVSTTDNKKMLVWVIIPAGFDTAKKYPAMLLCQGGPQSMLGQGFSTRWNYRVFASHGYVVVAPCRRGMPGFGQAWNEQISGDWGGQAMQDLLSAIDNVSAEKWCDRDRLACVGASFGGYSVYWMAGNHNKRFKAFIAHCGIFNTYSMYGSTEEMFFENFDKKGPYWENPENPSYTKFSPHLFVKNWDAPMLVIHNEKDFRVPLAEGLQAFTAAQLQNIPSRFLYFPDEGHWVNKPQNSVMWNRVFFEWLNTWVKK